MSGNKPPTLELTELESENTDRTKLNKKNQPNEYKNLFDKQIPLSPYSYLQKFNLLVNRQNYQLAKIRSKGEVGAMDLLPQPLEKIRIPAFFQEKHENRLNNQMSTSILPNKSGSMSPRKKKFVRAKILENAEFGKTFDNLKMLEKAKRPNMLESDFKKKENEVRTKSLDNISKVKKGSVKMLTHKESFIQKVKNAKTKESFDPLDLHERLLEDKRVYAQIYSNQRGPSITKIQTQEIYKNEPDASSFIKDVEEHQLLRSLGLNSHDKTMYTLYKIAGKFPERRVKNFLEQKDNQKMEVIEKLNSISEKFHLKKKIRPKIDMLNSLSEFRFMSTPISGTISEVKRRNSADKLDKQKENEVGLPRQASFGKKEVRFNEGGTSNYSYEYLKLLAKREKKVEAPTEAKLYGRVLEDEHRLQINTEKRGIVAYDNRSKLRPSLWIAPGQKQNIDKDDDCERRERATSINRRRVSSWNKNRPLSRSNTSRLSLSNIDNEEVQKSFRIISSDEANILFPKRGRRTSDAKNNQDSYKAFSGPVSYNNLKNLDGLFDAYESTKSFKSKNNEDELLDRHLEVLQQDKNSLFNYNNYFDSKYKNEKKAAKLKLSDSTRELKKSFYNQLKGKMSYLK